MSGVGNDWTSTLATGLHPTLGNVDAMTIDMFRATNGATSCAGFASYSHFLYVAWSTDAGQRIAISGIPAESLIKKPERRRAA